MPQATNTRANPERRPGLLIAFEGIDGCGKSSHLRKLAAFLRERGLEVVETREPTDGPYGRRIRELFTRRDEVSREEELELFLADRREHVAQCIEPGLAAGKIVLTDRYYFSTAAYQGAAGLDVDEILAKNRFAPDPDLVLLLEIAPEEGLRRIRERRGEIPNDFEQLDSLRRAAAIFASFDSSRICRIDTRPHRGMVQEHIRRLVTKLCRERGLLP